MPSSPAQLDAGDLCVVVLVYNRAEAIVRTLHELRLVIEAGARVIVVDNASADGSAEAVEQHGAGAELIRLDANVGVDGFNRGASASDRAFTLILDDDAWPDLHGLSSALGFMRGEPGVGGVMLRKTHPRTGVDEWPYGRVPTRERGWPDMGCGNLVRTDAWRLVGGYERRYFLYRNDTDLALSLLGAGFDVVYDPAWRVWHDSPVIRRQKPRWFRLATRNWVWMCRRHGARGWGILGALLGWAWAHRQAGWSPRRHWNTICGVASGLVTRAPALPAPVKPDGSALRHLLKLKAKIRGGPVMTEASRCDRHAPALAGEPPVARKTGVGGSDRRATGASDRA